MLVERNSISCFEGVIFRGMKGRPKKIVTMKEVTVHGFRGSMVGVSEG